MKPYRAHIRLRWHRVSLTLMLVFYPTIACVQAASAERTSSTPWTDIHAYVEAQMAELRIPGLALGIVHGDQIVHLMGFGIADPGGNPVTAQTTFSIGSFTKSFTAVALTVLPSIDSWR